MKICRECGTPCADDTVFCYVCGTKFHMNRITFDRGFVSEQFATSPDNMSVVLDSPAILLTDKDISNIYDILPLLEEVVKNGRQILIIANSFDKEIIDTLLVNKLRGALACAAVMAPGLGDRKEQLKDIAILTGGQVISSDAGLELPNATLALCGQAKTVRITKDETLILCGNGNEANIIERISQLKSLRLTLQSDYEKKRIQSRLTNLFGLTDEEI